MWLLIILNIISVRPIEGNLILTITLGQNETCDINERSFHSSSSARNGSSPPNAVLCHNFNEGLD